MKSNHVVEVSEESVTIPTYGTGKPEKNPMFLEKRVYQGSSGVIYPYPVIEKILDEKKDKTYKGLFLENQYLKILILPELGGRVQMAYDKIKKRHFVYYNHVIKPALVGLTGPWISGGIEFNWPQHHRPSTFDPLDYAVEEHADGSKTVWVNEVERMTRTKGMAGFRLYPDKAYLEINVKLYNRTPFPQTFLWWANPAVKVNDHYQSVFPPDVHAVFDHGKRDVSEFPIAKGTYYKVDYSSGVDISRYKNIPVPTSYMAIKSKYDFMGGYEHDAKGGLLHVANHHIAPGKKQWTWGNGEFGYAWDRNLTDEDGPYVELMTGVYTDNQPDFSWMQPYEERTFSQYFMPYSEMGIVKNATKDAMLNLEVEGKSVCVKFFTTSLQKNLKAILSHDDQVIWSDILSVSPEFPFVKTIALKEDIQADTLKVSLLADNGKILLEYQAEKESEKKVPEPAKGVKDPEEIMSAEQLFLTGLHIEQYRHATYKATDYYEEALRRDPDDVRNNNAMGLWLLKRGKFANAEVYFRKAIHTLTERNPNPYYSEPYFNLGTCLLMLNRFDDAYEAFYKSAWNADWQHPSYLNLARIAVRKENFEEALELINKSLTRNYSSNIARHLKTVILRKLNRSENALILAKKSIELDTFNYGCLYEECLLISQSENQEASLKLRDLRKRMRNYVHNYIEYAFDYMHAGLYDDAKNFLSLHIAENNQVYPMVYYYLGYFAIQNSEKSLGISFYKKAAALSPDYCFPNRIEDIAVLESAMELNPEDSKASYYLGNFWYANRQYDDAINCWEKSVHIDPNFPTVHRNLALAYHNKQADAQKALLSLEKSFRLNTHDGRVLMELDQLYKKLNKPHTERLKLLETHLNLVEDRDDLYLERLTLYNHLTMYKKAKELMSARKFHPWEGGEGKVVGQYLICHIELAKQAIAQERYTEALLLLEVAETYPDNLGEGKIFGTQENDVFFLKGCVFEGMGKQDLAKEFFKKATIGLSDPVQAIYYNDQQPDKILYQALAWKKLAEYSKGEEILRRLIDFGTKHIHDKIKIDYFAVSLPDLLVFDQDLDLKNKIHCHYMIALGYLGLGNGSFEKAAHHFDTILNLDINHIGAAVNKNMIQYNTLVESLPG